MPFFGKNVNLEHGKNDQKETEGAAERGGGKEGCAERAQPRDGEGGKGEREESPLLEETVPCMHGEGGRGHGEKGGEIDRLRLLLGDAAPQREEGDEHRPAAHTHPAEDPSRDARKKEDEEAHGSTILTPAASMTAEKSRAAPFDEERKRRRAPRSPPATAPRRTGRRRERER